ncbi:S-adenosyl-L-methionine-dependent methyltransferase [Hypoxylon trugodes]|uniref:S-adenosyl-L-methionine-dependent methyltransferase n=1 Tax=Hypoxylon trugodes TaxID=326681 RepID=UPI002197712C|nr:S-adenosyl-L-methionine-dependent methyltransferase [Hypoxylon trugodes]KAI1388065.1 S-adenosyl-L-methionine-dependent methyltransferase [Hypoxylon trugodes]
MMDSRHPLSKSPSISISEHEWEVEELSRDSAQATIERRFQEMPERTEYPVIDMTQDPDEFEQKERENEDLLEPAVANVIEVIDLTTSTSGRRPRNVVNPPRRNPSITLPNQWVNTYDFNGVELKPGTTVEITPLPRLYQASFLMIQLIVPTESGVILRGLPLTRTKNLRGKLPRLRNELVFILEIDQDDPRPEENQTAVEVPLAGVLKTRICHITNKNFPEHRFPTGIYKDVIDIEENAVLICRWKYKLIYANAARRVGNKPPTELVVARVIQREVIKDKFRTDDLCLMNVWRGGNVRGGSYIPDEPGSSRLTVDLDESSTQGDASQPAWVPKKPGQQFTFADMFCGAGGASLGAREAGFRVKLSCDNAAGACNTYRLNFPEADLHQEDMYDFIISMRDSTIRVDILHLSPPCQYWSPAHTTPGTNDDANIAILFACHELVKILRPRIFTLEQTFGILHPRFEYYFNALIYGFTQHGYSVRWKIANLLIWGTPSQRQRLVMIGSCPGEELPPYPAATHSKDPSWGDGTKRYRTAWSVLRRIPRDTHTHDELHQPRSMKRLRFPPWNPEVPLARTITCGGGVGNYHFSGKRAFTVREFAMLQSFPVDYQFQRPEQKRQVGNAFPPVVVKTLYKHLRRWLERKDLVHADSNELSAPESEGEEGNNNEPDWQHDFQADDDSDVECLGEWEVDKNFGEVEFLGARGINRNSSDIELLGGRRIRQHSSIVTIHNSDSEDGMDIDITSQGIRSPDICIDANQSKGSDFSRPILLD